MQPSYSYESNAFERVVTPTTAYSGYDGLDSEASTETEVTYEYCNIHHDPRVYRGNTYAKPIKSGDKESWTSSSKTVRKIRGIAEYRREQAARIYDPKYGVRNKAAKIDFTRNLVDPNDLLPPKTFEKRMQTDNFKWRAPEKYFVQPLGGVDAEAQVINAELFDFDVESEPLLKILVSKVLFQAQDELEKYAEMTSFDRRTRSLLHHRLMRECTKRVLEKQTSKKLYVDRKIIEESKRKKKYREALSRKVACVQMGGHCWNTVRNDALDGLLRDGKFIFPITRRVEEDFFPMLLQQVDEKQALQRVARMMIDELCAFADDRLRRLPLFMTDCSGESVDISVAVPDGDSPTDTGSIPQLLEKASFKHPSDGPRPVEDSGVH